MKILEIVAILGALAWTPHLYTLLKSIFTRPLIRIICERFIEIGYTPFGPILNLRIAFSVQHRDIVISSIKIKIKHEGGEEKILSWHGITQMLHQMRTRDIGTIPVEKESSVLAIKLNEKDIEERYIRFQEDEFHINKSEHESKVEKKLIFLKGKGEDNIDKFMQSEEMKDLCSFIKQWFNWKKGKYTLIFELYSPKKFKLKDNVYEFTLNPINIELLESNKDLITLSYEAQFKLSVDGYKPPSIDWKWVYSILKKTII